MSVKDLAKKGARAGEPQVLSTSEARAKFAETLEAAQMDCAIIGFDRYGRTIAAVVPVEAVYLLAGLEHMVPQTARARIKKQARLFVEAAPTKVRARPAASPKRAPGKAAKKKAEPERPARPRRRTR